MLNSIDKEHSMVYVVTRGSNSTMGVGMTMDYTQVMLATIGLISAMAVIGGPIITARMLRRDMRLDKEQDYARLDEVAEKAEAAAARNASLIAESNQRQSKDSVEINGKLDVIHINGNSTLTAAMVIALDGLKRELLLLEAMPTPMLIMIEVTKKKIEEFEAIIDERNKQTGIADGLQRQKAEAIRASDIVGNPIPKLDTPPSSIGAVTERVLRGEPPSVAAADHRKGQADAAAATVAAADKTVDAAAKTVEAMKKGGV